MPSPHPGNLFVAAHYSLSEQLLSSYYVPHTVLSMGGWELLHHLRIAQTPSSIHSKIFKNRASNSTCEHVHVGTVLNCAHMLCRWEPNRHARNRDALRRRFPDTSLFSQLHSVEWSLLSVEPCSPSPPCNLRSPNLA